MSWSTSTECSAFLGHTLLGRGPLNTVVPLCKPHVDAGEPSLLIFTNADSSRVEVDFRGSLDEVLMRLPPALPTMENSDLEAESTESPRRGRGRPKLGVVAREVTLLPRHWEWLKSQPGGASVALRKLVEAARKDNAVQDQRRGRQDATYRFMSIMAGSLAGFEEASRALFAGDAEKFVKETGQWPADVRDHARSLASPL